MEHFVLPLQLRHDTLDSIVVFRVLFAATNLIPRCDDGVSYQSFPLVHKPRPMPTPALLIGL